MAFHHRRAGLIASLVLGSAIALPGFAAAEEITVFAAASLKNALDQIAADWQTIHRQFRGDLLRRHSEPGQADRRGRTGRSLHFGIEELDGHAVLRTPDQGRQPQGHPGQHAGSGRGGQGCSPGRNQIRSGSEGHAGRRQTVDGVGRFGSCRANTAKRRWKPLESGPRSRPMSPSPKTCARRLRWWRRARRPMASSTPLTPLPPMTSGDRSRSSAPSRQTATSQSSTLRRVAAFSTKPAAAGISGCPVL